MTQQTEALNVALDALRNSQDYKMGRAITVEAVELIEEYLAQPESCKYGQEPKSCTSSPMDCQCAIDAALAQPAVAEQHKQEPGVYIPADALRQLNGTSLLILRSVPLYGYRGDGLTPLYTTPPQRKPLTNGVIKQHIFEHTKLNPNLRDDQELIGYIVNAVRAIEAAHGIKE